MEIKWKIRGKYMDNKWKKHGKNNVKKMENTKKV